MESLFWALRTLGKPLVKEVQHLAKVDEEMEWLRSEILLMQNHFYEADQSNQLADERVKQWVKEIRSAAFFAECIVAKYAFKSRRSSVGCKPKWYHAIYNDIKKLKNKLQNIKDHKDRYRITDIYGNRNPGINEKIEQCRRNSFYKKTEKVVSFKNHIDSLKKQLYSDKPRLYVVSVVGMGGVGKTTLASLVFKSSDVQELFPIRVWVDLSQKYIDLHRIESLLREIARQTNPRTEDLKGKNFRELSELVERNLEGKRYLIVMDDMWEEEVWHLIKEHLPDESNASRIMITTRNENVARHPASHFTPYKLQCLDGEQSRNLFTKLMFGNDEGLNWEGIGELQQIAGKLVDKCGGSPLALDCLVDSLAGKDRTPKEWKSVLERGEWLHPGSRCMETLKLSYTCLPIHLKWCFLYLSAFPEDSKIEVERLTKLWVAEGFVSTEEEMWKKLTSSAWKDINNAEDLAMSYLKQLKARCLVDFPEETSEQIVNGRVKYCTIHNLHQLLCVAEAEALDFMDFCDNTPINNNAYRLAIHIDIKSHQRVLRKASSLVRKLDLVGARFSLRTLLHFKSEESSIRCRSFCVLKVLDLEGAKIDRLPKQIGSMVCLHYLSIKETPCRELPKSIIKLPSLETLDCRVKGEFSMPKEIWKITTLTHVYGTKLRCDCDVKCADKLKTLESVFLCRQIEESIKNCKQLRVLHIHIPDQREGTEIKNGFWKDLQDLPALESLYFDLSGYTYMEMKCLSGKFPKLQSLTLENFEGRKWEVEEGSMRFLETLSLRKCTNLRNLQYGLRGCSELRELSCSDMGQAFQEWYQNDGVVDFNYVTWNIIPPI